MNLQKVLERAYRNEINVELYSFWDAGWTVKLGDVANGYKETDSMINTDKLAGIIHKMILRHYPKSEYVEKYGEGQE